MVDGVGSLHINADAEVPETSFKAQDEVIIRRRTSRTGPTTNEVLVGRVLAMYENGTAKVSVQKPGGVSQHVVLSVRELSPVTDSFRRQSLQFNPAMRPRV